MIGREFGGGGGEGRGIVGHSFVCYCCLYMLLLRSNLSFVGQLYFPECGTRGRGEKHMDTMDSTFVLDAGMYIGGLNLISPF